MLPSLLTTAGVLLALCATSAPTSAQAITSERIADGLMGPVFACSPPGDSDRLFVVERGGSIKIIDDLQTNPTLLTTDFLQISGVASGFEQGLLGLAFHPDYANNGRFFINYTENLAGNVRVVEYAVSAADPNVADPTPVQIVIEIVQPFASHNGGCIQFSPNDGYLYIGLGDGGGGGDPLDSAQNPNTLLGKIVRLDVDAVAPFIPASNPFVGVAGTLDEIWASGLRNPWRFSFDRANGDMYIGDVGQNAWEEVSFQPGTSTGGENYGWRCMEGDSCYTNSNGCTCNDTNLTDPIQAYNHSQGVAVTGGYVYRGAAIPALDGSYFYADFGTNKIWSFRYDGTNLTDFTDRTMELFPASGTLSNITSFGEDALGELYFMGLSGEIWKIVKDCGSVNFCQTSPNSTGNHGAITTSGSLSVQDNSFTLVANSLPQGQFAFFLGGTERDLVFNPNGSAGNLCVGGQLARFNLPSQIGQANSLGTFEVTLDLTSIPLNPTVAVQPGETWTFQCWHREIGMGQSNFTDGIEVTFCP